MTNRVTSPVTNRTTAQSPPTPNPLRLLPLCLLATLAMVPDAASAQRLGPVDGFDLPRTDIERVATGDEAPLFTLESFDRGPVDLAGFRGNRNVVLVFYRGHW